MGKHSNTFILVFAALLLLAAAGPEAARAARADSEKAPAAAAGEPEAPKSPEPVTEQRMAAAAEKLDQARTLLRKAKRGQDDLGVKFSGWRQKILSWEAELAGSLSAARLERLIADSDRALSGMESGLAELSSAHQSAAGRMRDLDAQIEILSQSMKGANTGERGMMGRLSKLLANRRDVEKSLWEIYGEEVDSLQALRTAAISLQESARDSLSTRKKEQLLSRNPLAVEGLVTGNLAWEAGRAADRLGGLASPAFWTGRRAALGEEGFSGLNFSVFLGVVLLVASRTGWVLVRYAARKKEEEGWFHRRRAMAMAGRYLPLAALAAYLYAYGRILGPWRDLPILPTLTGLLSIWLFALWALQFLRFARESGRGPFSGPENRQARILAWTTAAGFSLYMAVSWALLGDSPLLFAFRVVFCFVLAGFILFFARISRPRDPAPAPLSRAFRSLAAAGAWLGAGGALALDLAGYGALASWWVVSFCRTLVALLWIGVLLGALSEGEAQLHLALTARDPERPAMHPGGWLLLRLAWLAWAGAACVALLAAWGAEPSFILAFFKLLNRPVPVGDMHFSALSLVWAVLILALTHVVVKVFSRVFRDRVLADSGMEQGLKESATTLTSYALWGLGILVALNVLGVSATSLTVALGAIGIGLGFGLQNIFNNFLSGIILLFERPIQVGDNVEVAGTWGRVEKINVRSTVIQTYDNASLIIPNSEFIANQVTNWSFKDLRVRRKINVGVAYGSDVDLVKRLLLEAAEENPRVLRRPRPDVLFTDFGDSALMFSLRFWSHVDFFLAVETELRFAINRKFAENNVSIPFPQRDLWIKSLPTPGTDGSST